MSTKTFAVFAVTFMVTRIMIFPIYLIFPFWNGKMNDTIKMIEPGINVLDVFNEAERAFIPWVLLLLFVLQCIWAVFIVKMAFNITVKKEIKDVRENEEKTKKDKE